MLRLFQRLIALALAFVWLPLTLCCNAEAALDDVFSLCNDCCSDKSAAAEQRDGCALVEDGKYSSSVADLKVFDPAEAGAIGGMIPLNLAVPPRGPEAGIRPAEPERPRDWVPSWQFVRRAAAPAHAPDSSIA